MSTSYQNILDTGKIKDTLGSLGDQTEFNQNLSQILRTQKTEPRYIKGYADDTFWDAMANKLGLNKGIIQQLFGTEKRKLDNYDPYHTSDAKKEDFYFDGSGTAESNRIDGKTVQKTVDENTFAFKSSLYSEYGFRKDDFLYEDPLLLGFELFIDPLSPLFVGDDNENETGVLDNSIKSFFSKYSDMTGEISNRFPIWTEFKKIILKLFETKTPNSSNINKPYYINKIDGLANLKKKMINYGEDKITITLNEDVSMITWYLADLYNNLIYSYRNQRYMFPLNTLRFNLIIKFGDVRNFVTPQSTNVGNDGNNIDPTKITNSTGIKNTPSAKSQIYYTLHDCNFMFFDSSNFNDSMDMAGFGMGASNTPATLSFDIIFKSVTRWSEFPLIKNSYPLNGWEDYIYSPNYEQKYFSDIDRLKTTPPEKKGYLNQKIGALGQTVANTAIGYVDNFETSLRNLRGNIVEGALQQLQDFTNIKKIEPDNVYNSDFNNRISLNNLGKELASGIINDLTGEARNIANF